MRCIIEKITTEEDMKEACCFTLADHPEDTTMTLEKIYNTLHSPARTQWFKIKLYDIPQSVSVHFVRHNVGGVLHFVRTKRPDRNPNGTEKQMTLKDYRALPTDHLMWINAESLINLAHKRLCFKSEKPTVEVMRVIVNTMYTVDPDLFPHLVPQCIHLNKCPELKTCGFFKDLTGGTGKQHESTEFTKDLWKEGN